MKVKTKLIATFMSICLVCAVFAIGVFALKTANLKIGGDVSFNAIGVEAHIKNASLSSLANGQTIAASDEKGEYINTSMTQTNIDATFATWQNLTLAFNANADDIVFSFDIANISATNSDRYIAISYTCSFSTENPNVNVFPGETTGETWANNNYILEPKGETPAVGDYETFTLKFRVLDKELNVKANTKVNLTIKLENTTPSVGTLNDVKLTTAKGVIYTVDKENNTATLNSTNKVGDNYPEKENVVIEPVVSDGENNYIVTAIADNAFFSGDYSVANTTLKSIEIPNSVTTIGSSAFYKCTALTSITLPEGVTSIGDEAFFKCTSLETVNFPSSLKTIGTHVFNGCSNLSTIDIPDSVNSIGYGAFQACPITTITIPNGVPSIGGQTFSDCVNLISITIPNSVTSIGDWDFSNCKKLKEIILPSGLKTIGYKAFTNCEELTTITIPSSVTSIAQGVIVGCTKLTTAKFENPNGWYMATSKTATTGTSVPVSSSLTQANAKVFKDCAEYYLLRNDA
ncbi:MAG: leucine-rich repeat domain-containing protein [Clostridia bacterium]|nr:leucine-rich repeat domain-containing protein [Clostridia bacterium]